MSNTRSNPFRSSYAARLQSGRTGAGVLLGLAVVAAFLAACSAPPAHYSDPHAVFVERAKAAGW